MVRKAVKGIEVNRALKIAAGKDVLSRVRQMELPARIQPKKLAPLEGFAIAHTELAKLVAGCLTDRFPTIHEAAAATGLTPTTLVDVLNGKHQSYLREHTWVGLSALAGRSIKELREYYRRSLPPSGEVGDGAP